MNAPAKQQQATESSLEDQLSDAFDSLEAADAAKPEPETTGEIETDGELETSEDTTETEETELEATDEEQEPIEAVEAHETDEAVYDTPAPERWPAEMRERYAKLPPEARKLLMEDVYKPMQATYTKNTQEFAAKRKSVEPMIETLQRYREQFDKAGISPQQAFDKAMAWESHRLNVSPEQYQVDWNKAHGIESKGQQSDDSDEWLTPFEKRMKAQLDDVTKQISSTATQAQEREQAQRNDAQQRHQHEVSSGIQNFAQATKNGKPLHPHFEKVAQHMTGLIQGGVVSRQDSNGQPLPMAQQLESAYEMACRLDPSIAAAQTTQTRAEQVKKAAAANRSVVDKNPAGQVDVSGRPLTDTINDVYDQLNR